MASETTDPSVVDVFGEAPRVKMVAVMLDADGRLTPTEIVEEADVGRSTFYRHLDDLREAGVMADIDASGLYAIDKEAVRAAVGGDDCAE